MFLSNTTGGDQVDVYHGGGAIMIYDYAFPVIQGNIIMGNYGGGIYTYSSNPSIINNTIAYNSTFFKYYPGQGGGIAAEGNLYPVLRNWIIWNNISSIYTMNVYWPVSIPSITKRLILTCIQIRLLE